MTFKSSVLAVSLCVLSWWAMCAYGQKGGTLYEDNYAGDRLRIQTFVNAFEADKKNQCAPPGTGLIVVREEENGILIVRFYDILTEAQVKKDFNVAVNDREFDRLWEECRQSLVNTYTSYRIPKKTLLGHDFKRSGVMFGGLVVPFKYRLSGDKGIVSSSTIAPYVGIRSRYLEWFGLAFTPVFSAGIAFVPVRNDSGDSGTKNAMSFSAGLVMTTSKDQKFNAGVLIGRDVLSDSDRALDRNVDKPWLSFYLGFEM